MPLSSGPPMEAAFFLPCYALKTHPVVLEIAHKFLLKTLSFFLYNFSVFSREVVKKETANSVRSSECPPARPVRLLRSLLQCMKRPSDFTASVERLMIRTRKGLPRPKGRGVESNAPQNAIPDAKVLPFRSRRRVMCPQHRSLDRRMER